MLNIVISENVVFVFERLPTIFVFRPFIFFVSFTQKMTLAHYFRKLFLSGNIIMVKLDNLRDKGTKFVAINKNQFS